MARTWPDIRPVYYGTAAERAAFPASGEAAGALFFDYDDETWYYWDGAAWQQTAPAGVDPSGHTHSKVVASDGAPDPSWSVDADGNLTGVGSITLPQNKKITFTGDTDTYIISPLADTIDIYTGGGFAARFVENLPGAGYFKLLLGAYINEISTDGSLAGNSDEAATTEQAVKTYVDNSARVKVKNTSGSAAAANDLGYVDENGEYKTTATAYSDVAWCVVIVGGANNADIYVARRGRVTVALNGNCSVGDYLYTSTTAGQAQPQSYTRPELFAVALTANGAGAGGTCEALLLTQTRYVNVQSSVDVFSVSPTTSTDFVATIATLPGGAVLTYNAPSSGAENTIDPTANNLHGKLRLYNSTRGDYALIDDVATGTNTITLTANVPGTWQVGDTITARSQTVTPGGAYYYDIDLSSADNTAIPELARALEIDISALDTVVGQDTRFHPWDTYAGAKVQVVPILVASQNHVRSVSLPLFQRRYAVQVNAAGAATAYHYHRLKGYWVAEP